MIEITPAKIKLSLGPGDSYNGSFQVKNTGEKSFDYRVFAAAFGVDENYEIDYGVAVAYSQITDWVTFEAKTESGTLGPDEEIEVIYTVNIPADAAAGGQYVALLAETVADDVGEIRRAGTILYTEIDGEIFAGAGFGEIIENRLGGFYLEPDVKFMAKVENSGNIEQATTYAVNVWPLFGSETVYSTAVAATETLAVIPGTARELSDTWEDAPAVGIFWATQTIEFADQSSEAGGFVVICPLWLIILLVLVLAAIFGVIFGTIFGRKLKKSVGQKPRRADFNPR